MSEALKQQVIAEPERPAAKEKVEVPSNVPELHTVKEGDTLWDITESYYGDPYRWPQVWSYNPDITNPHWIYPDATVRLRPGDDEVVKTAPRGFSYSKTRTTGNQAIYMAEYGFLNKDALKDAGYIIGANEEHMMMVDTDMVYVRFNEGFKPDIGRVYTVFRTMQKFEREPSEKGTLVRIIGEVQLQDYIVTDPVERSPAGSLCQEHRKPDHMTMVRTRIVRSVVEAFGCDQFFVYTGHPLLTHGGRFIHEAAIAS